MKYTLENVTQEIDAFEHIINELKRERKNLPFESVLYQRLTQTIWKLEAEQHTWMMHLRILKEGG